MKIAILCDWNPAAVRAHAAIPKALALAGAGAAEWVCLGTREVGAGPAGFSGLWCAPGSPYQNPENVLRAIRWARENQLPFLGTCGGFQHALLEWSRHEMAWADAAHEEENPGAARAVVARLACPLRGAQGLVRLRAGTRLAAIYGADEVSEEFNCGYGFNMAYRAGFEHNGLRFSAFDAAGELRAIELEDHPFYFGTLFQPELSAFAGRPHPLIRAFVAACRVSGGNRGGTGS